MVARYKKAFGPFAGILYSLITTVIKLSNVPVIKKPIERIASRKRYKVITIPVDIPVHGNSAVLHFDAAKKLIEASSHITVIRACVCREGKDCKAYPKDLGCLFLGQGARSMSLMGRAREIGKEEALEHLQKARSLGLVNNVIWSSVELRLLGADARHTVELCACCPCCCLAFKTRDASRAFIDGIAGFGLAKVMDSEGCTRCMTCERSCPFKAIHVDARAGPVIDAGRCKGCGRCETLCNNKVIKVLPLESTMANGVREANAGSPVSGEAYFEQFLSMVK
ncbi:4Fe-4S binding protein [Methanocella conradii]|uniref:4Fe-4S binding protein n=1 Tax=Methanocella conradii TaxID=1175444 RepID=UPI0024B33A29|nr:4Fe-4S binding protein [Methanocella conradii]MDI6896809.1 4Fe-4S binding protein [Methanocella conradii]